jgi:hypothetical protein
MHLVSARPLLRTTPCSSLGSLLPCRPTLTTHRSQLQLRRYSYSKCDTPYETPAIKFGTETASSSSLPCFTLQTSLHLRAPLHRVWDAFHVPATLNAITPPHLNFTVTTPQPVGMREGTIIDYRFSLRCSTAYPRPPPLTRTLRPQPAPPRRALQLAHTARQHWSRCSHIPRLTPAPGFRGGILRTGSRTSRCARACEGPQGQCWGSGTVGSHCACVPHRSWDRIPCGSIITRTPRRAMREATARCAATSSGASAACATRLPPGHVCARRYRLPLQPLGNLAHFWVRVGVTSAVLGGNCWPGEGGADANIRLQVALYPCNCLLCVMLRRQLQMQRWARGEDIFSGAVS